MRHAADHEQVCGIKSVKYRGGRKYGHTWQVQVQYKCFRSRCPAGWSPAY